jgi:hypothetical protein
LNHKGEAVNASLSITKEKNMDEIKGMSDADARKWLSRHGYGVGDIDMIMAGEDPTADDMPPPPPAPPVVEKVAPVKKAAPKSSKIGK